MPTIAEIYATANAHHPIDAGNAAFFAMLERTRGAEAVFQFKDNVALCYYGDAHEAQDSHAVSAELLAQVYAAAKVVFARYPGQTLTYDLPAAADFCGSPWEAEIATPEQWVVHVGRRVVADEDCAIGDDFSAEQVASGVCLINDLLAIGLSQAQIDAYFDDICHDNDAFKAALQAALDC